MAALPASHVAKYPEGGEGGAERPLGRANTSARPTGVCTGHRPAAAGTLAAEPTPWLDCDSAGQRDGRRPRPAAGRGGDTHGVRTYALTVVNARGFPIRGTVARHPAG